MKKYVKIGVCSVMTMMAISHSPLFAKDKVKKHTTKLPPFSIGYNSGRELLFNSSPLIRSRQSKVHSGITNTLVLRKPINQHFSFESGLGTTRFSQSYFNDAPSVKNISRSLISVPATVQYTFFQKKRCHPYIGAGVQYNINASSRNISFYSDNLNYLPVPASSNNGKYVSVLLTQGITFEIDTKLDVRESLHVIPAGCCKTIGIDMGIGYRFH